MTAYDSIGREYSAARREDHRIASQIQLALGSVNSIVNVGAGTGSYEPRDCRVIAVEPSAVMIAQRAAEAAPAVQGRAELLPFRDRSFDAALAVLTIHHWGDQREGLEQCARVARTRVVLVTWDPESDGFWLMQEYFPEILALDRRIFPTMDRIASALGDIEIRKLMIPADCIDGFLGAYWRRPQAYLDPRVRTGISTFSMISNVEDGVARLEEDLANGEWAARYGNLLDMENFDAGYRVIIANA